MQYKIHNFLNIATFIYVRNNQEKKQKNKAKKLRALTLQEKSTMLTKSKK